MALSYNDQPVSEETFITLRTMDVEAGRLGWFFGTSKNAPFNIAGFALFVIFGIGAIVAWKRGFADGIEYYKWAGPLISVIIGYIIGKK